MSVVLSPWPVGDTGGRHWRRLSVSCGFLDRADACAAEGDLSGAAHFFRLAEDQIDKAVALASAVNAAALDGVDRLREIARRFANGRPEAAQGHAIEFRCAQDGDTISVWLTIGRAGAEANALMEGLIGPAGRGPIARR